MYELKTEAAFDSAHFLADYYGKCENLHGHRWRVVAAIGAEELGEEGTMRDMVLDFTEFKRIVRALALELDHCFLVEEGTLKPATIEALEGEGFALKIVPWRTTAENIATHFARRMEEEGLPVTWVEVYETPNNCAKWTRDR